ncbi:MAG: hypothetical protein A3F91_00450 [Flavobacteria bacterium RIFCSPLOWO2_12_FULL_35_11]|nr:MAG: hypothetical protein A3F91_00450 [Flavobacteria bacterium RIFCSPLOWO2_12_FULL_35_11]
MKTKLLLLATFLFVGFGVQASTFKTDNSSINNYYNDDYGDSFTFVERDVTFAIFQNGEFDFYINPRNQRGGLDVNYQGNGVNISFNSGYDYGPYVQYDDYGAIIQIEDIPIYYDYYGRVNRIGNTRITYDSGRLIRVGGLHVYYDRQGYYSHYSGYINTYNRSYVFHPYHNYFARPLFDFRIVSYDPYRNHYQPTRYTYYSDHSRNKYYSKNNKRDGHDTRRVAAKSVPNRYNDKHNDRAVQQDRRSSNDRTSQNGRSNTVNNTDRRSNTVQRPTSNERTSQNGRSNGAVNNTERRSNTVQRPTSNERTSQNGRSNGEVNNTERRSNTVQRPTSNERTSQNGRSNGAVNNTDRRVNTVNKPSQNERSAANGRMADNRAPQTQRTAQAPERVQQRNNTANTQKGQSARESKGNDSNGKSDKKENSRGNSSRRN